MPDTKAPRIDDMPEGWELNEDIPLADRIRAMNRLAGPAEPLNFPRGVHKYRSFEEAQAHLEQFEQARAERIRAKQASEEAKS